LKGKDKVKKKEERVHQIVQTLKKRKGATIKELAALFDVSEMTIRRDMEVLKSQGIILDIHGAAVYNPQSAFDLKEEGYSLEQATTSRKKEKDSIGAYAAALIEDDECVIIDNGSTTECLAAHIDNSVKATIFSCNLNIMNKLYNKPNLKLIFGGGYFHPDTAMFESPESLTLIRRTRAAKVFVSAAGVHETLGVTCASSYEQETKLAILESAAERILVSDSSKFGVVTACFIAELGEFHKVITDKELPEEWQERIKELGIELIMV